MRGCNCGTTHQEAHAPGCAGFAVEYYALQADNDSLRAEVERLTAELHQLNGTPQRRFLEIMRHFERVFGPHPGPFRSDEVGEAHYLRVVERLRTKGEALAKALRRHDQLAASLAANPDLYAQEHLARRLAEAGAALAEWEKP